ncbi:MAG TPA: hypothetical protein VMB85_04230 [Bryobacteraceae bacterium]|nr:hypothetical protein [Bryobacteraceae bacterium]
MDRWSYSVVLRDEWREKPERYFFVSQAAAGDDFGWQPGIYWGARPNALAEKEVLRQLWAGRGISEAMDR